ncbi:hypothetical protein [Actinosynnema mirum]|uniref:Uncharacterized protein n=1 Tax=Actinosynnema mirum (strain ATCC 29888 / DSM 43827 / JCM 3225 / NBRC 14064 / NCIMB 13271 / NRRL B-12336 / IMRU 3971 / 101) TaxID=446462 RepID=C6WBC4_ACTMD|nr:hypothetical protein [Actinosynnema mirum]ACU39415.1 hypothetical protein Amir_5597 [Actinosynnema mirum DSM 43827]
MNTVQAIATQMLTVAGTLLAVRVTGRVQDRRARREERLLAFTALHGALEDYRRCMFVLVSLRLVRAALDRGQDPAVVRAELDAHGVRVDHLDPTAEQIAEARAASHAARSALSAPQARLIMLSSYAVRMEIQNAVGACKDIREAQSFSSLQDRRRYAKTAGEELLLVGAEGL